MATLNLPGLATGIDTAKIIEQLMDVNRNRLRRYTLQKEEYQAEKSAIVELETKLKSLESASEGLSDTSQLKSYNATTSDEDIMTATANSNAFEGNHSIQIKQLATAERWVHDGLEFAEDRVGGGAGGTFIYSYNNKETSIITAADTSLEDLVGLINNDSNNPGINASLLVYDDGEDGVYHLVLSGKNPGSNYAISVNDSNTELWKGSEAFMYGGVTATESTKIVNLEHTGTYTGDETITITGDDHYGDAITPVVLNINDDTKISHILSEIEDAFDGNVVATLEKGIIYVTDTASGSSSLRVDLAYAANGGLVLDDADPLTMVEDTDGGTVENDLAGFTAADFVKTQSAQDSMIKVDGYPAITAVPEVQEITQSAVAATSGYFYLTYGGQTTCALSYAADLATIQAELELLSSVDSGDITVGGSALSLVSNMIFTFSDTLGDVEKILLDDSGLSNNFDVTEETKGRSSWVRRSSNTIDDVISGVTLNLHDTTWDGVGDPDLESSYNDVNVNLTRDIEGLKEKIQAMLDGYNTVMRFIDEKTGYDDEKKAWGELSGDYTITSITSRIKSPFNLAASGFTADDSFQSPSDIGITVDSDGMVSMDTEIFDEAIIDDYLGVLDLIGAMKTGTSDSDYIKFYGAGTHTTAGEYEVEVDVSAGGAITAARIKQSDDTWRTVDFPDNIDGNTVFATDSGDIDDYGNPLYAEHNLVFTVDLSQTDQTLSAKIYVRQGFAGATDDVMNDLLGIFDGTIPKTKTIADTRINNMEDRIESEQSRLEKVEERLVQKFARLERTLSMIQQQMGALSMM